MRSDLASGRAITLKNANMRFWVLGGCSKTHLHAIAIALIEIPSAPYLPPVPASISETLVCDGTTLSSASRFLLASTVASVSQRVYRSPLDL